jgi:hypothetical protein
VCAAALIVPLEKEIHGKPDPCRFRNVFAVLANASTLVVAGCTLDPIDVIIEGRRQLMNNPGAR